MLKGLQLSILAGPVVPVPLPSAFVEALESVSASTGNTHGFELKFILDRRSPLPMILTANGINLPDFRIILTVLLRGMPHVLADGIITHHQVDVSQSQPRLIIQGEGVAAAMNRDDFTDLMQYPALTASARVSALLLKYMKFGVIPAVVPTLAEGVPNPMLRTPTHRGTDSEYIQLLADAAGAEFFIVPGPAPGTNLAYWGPKIRLGLPQPPLNADMDVHRNVETLSFRLLAEQHEQPVLTIQEPITKFPIPIPIPSFSPLAPPFGMIRPQARRTTRTHDVSKMEFTDALLKGFSQMSRAQDTIAATGSLNVLRYGHVLRAKSLVSVCGGTMPYDGLYFVDQVSSSIERGKFTQSFSLVRDGLVSTVPLAPLAS